MEIFPSHFSELMVCFCMYTLYSLQYTPSTKILPPLAHTSSGIGIQNTRKCNQMQSFVENNLIYILIKSKKFRLNCHVAPFLLRLPFNKIVFTIRNMYHHRCSVYILYLYVHIKSNLIKPFHRGGKNWKFGAFSSACDCEQWCKRSGIAGIRHANVKLRKRS